MKPIERFQRLRKVVMKAIGEQLADDPCCKSYEGHLNGQYAIQITLMMNLPKWVLPTLC